MSEVVSRCRRCGRSFDTEAWQALEYVGVQEVPADGDDPGWALELRNCPCGSTLAIRIDTKPKALGAEMDLHWPLEDEPAWVEFNAGPGEATFRTEPVVFLKLSILGGYNAPDPGSILVDWRRARDHWDSQGRARIEALRRDPSVVLVEYPRLPGRFTEQVDVIDLHGDAPAQLQVWLDFLEEHGRAPKVEGFGATTEPPMEARWPQGITNAGFQVDRGGATVDGKLVAYLTMHAWYTESGSYLTVGWQPVGVAPSWLTASPVTVTSVEEARKSPGRFTVFSEGLGRSVGYVVELHPDEVGEFNVWLDKLEEYGIS